MPKQGPKHLTSIPLTIENSQLATWSNSHPRAQNQPLVQPASQPNRHHPKSGLFLSLSVWESGATTTVIISWVERDIAKSSMRSTGCCLSACLPPISLESVIRNRIYVLVVFDSGWLRQVVKWIYHYTPKNSPFQCYHFIEGYEKILPSNLHRFGERIRRKRYLCTNLEVIAR